jgi:hypothetical protein
VVQRDTEPRVYRRPKEKSYQETDLNARASKDGVKVSRLLLIDTANDTSGAWLPHLAAGRFACGDQSGRTSALAGVTKNFRSESRGSRGLPHGFLVFIMRRE